MRSDVVQIFEGKVGGYDVGIGVIGRVLDGTEIVDLVLLGNNDDAAGVLACGTLNANTGGQDRKSVV